MATGVGLAPIHSLNASSTFSCHKHKVGSEAATPCDARNRTISSFLLTGPSGSSLHPSRTSLPSGISQGSGQCLSGGRWKYSRTQAFLSLRRGAYLQLNSLYGEKVDTGSDAILRLPVRGLCGATSFLSSRVGNDAAIRFGRASRSTRQNGSKRTSSIARCEADNASYNDRPMAMDSSEIIAEGDRYAGGDISSSKNGSVVEEVSQSTPVASQESKDEPDEDSPLEVLKEILRAAQEDLVDCRINSEKTEEQAQMVAELAIALRDEAADAEKLANATMSKVEDLLGEESKAEEELIKATAACVKAGEVVKQAEKALEEALRKVQAEKDQQPVLEASLNEEDAQDVAKAKLELYTERTVETSVTVDDSAGSEPVEVLMDTETTVTNTKVSVEGMTPAAALSVANSILHESEMLEKAKAGFREAELIVAKCELDLSRILTEKQESQQELMALTQAADKAKETALAADEDVAKAMAEAEKAVALELHVAQRVSDAEIALQKAESYALEAVSKAAAFAAAEAEKLAQQVGKTLEQMEEELEHRGEVEHDMPSETRSAVKDIERVDIAEEVATKVTPVLEKMQDEEPKASEPEKVEAMKEPAASKSKKRSSRFFPASYFSSDDGEEFSPGKAFATFATNLKPQLAKIIIGTALLLAGGAYVNNRLEKRAMLPPAPEYSSSIQQVTADPKPIIREIKKLTNRVKEMVDKIPSQEVNEEERSLFDVLWLLLASVIFVPLFMKIPGGSPVLGYLVAGVLIGPHTLHIIRHVHGTKAIAEFGVVFLLFNIGLELSVERLSSMKKYVFGLGTTQVLATAATIGLFLHFVTGMSGPAALVIGNGLALSSTAVVLQVLQERGESTSRHGRATFSVLLFQDLAVVVLLILIPLLGAKGGVGFKEIAEALGIAAIKAVIAICGIIAGGRLLLRPVYKQMADNHNAEIFAANTLLVVLGTSVLTARAGLSMALGAFLAGLLLAETEFALQVESDIAPYRGLLLGLFFMTVGMSIDPQLFVAKFREILGALAALIIGKTVLFAAVGRLFGLSTIAAIRAGLLLAPGGEFAFVAFGEAVNQGIMTSEASSLLFLVVGLSMALTPWLAAGGQLIAARFEQSDMRSLLPQENETDDLQGHIIICGFGRVGQIIAQLLSERLIPFVALDVRSERVAVGRALDLPVYFGDAGSREVLHKIGADRAAAAVITLDTPGANYRTVWALSKHYPKVKTFVRAHDVDHGINLEKAGATAVVPETLEPSLQLAAAVLAQAKVPASDIASAIDDFRSRHLSELTELSDKSGTSLGYGFSRVMVKPKQDIKIIPDEEVVEPKLDGGIIAVP
ncbi:K+:H+ antiporter [Marchantia polymorpha subsp. ruderalis]